jgi:hypothetical protein
MPLPVHSIPSTKRRILECRFSYSGVLESPFLIQISLTLDASLYVICPDSQLIKKKLRIFCWCGMEGKRGQPLLFLSLSPFHCCSTPLCPNHLHAGPQATIWRAFCLRLSAFGLPAAEAFFLSHPAVKYIGQTACLSETFEGLSSKLCVVDLFLNLAGVLTL